MRERERGREGGEREGEREREREREREGGRESPSMDQQNSCHDIIVIEPIRSPRY